jgi:hypothetical protein
VNAGTYFLMLHEEAHTRGKAVRVFGVPTPDQWRVVLPGHNSIAWNVWHIARGEDWAVTVLRGGEQLLTRDGWDRRMGAMRRDFGAGMAAIEAAELSAAIDLDALRGYWHAVYEETRRFVHGFDFDTLAEPMEAAAQCTAMDLLGPGGEPMRESVEHVWTTRRGYLNVMTLMDVYYHLDEADHVVRMLMPDHKFF